MSNNAEHGTRNTEHGTRNTEHGNVFTNKNVLRNKVVKSNCTTLVTDKEFKQITVYLARKLSSMLRCSALNDYIPDAISESVLLYLKYANEDVKSCPKKSYSYLFKIAMQCISKENTVRSRLSLVKLDKMSNV